ncbi:MAG: polysaccharide biosynthesis/export family protein [Bacteroidaceae bacterium]|nr:polysaccharide biosynthesis/export family protein [Bacteroidaceae bacterium]
MKTIVKLSCLFVIVMMTSCVKRGDYIYLQDMDDKLEYPVVQKYETVIQRDDKLSIKVGCKSPELALAFNIFGESGYSVSSDGSISANNTNMSADSRVSGYTVGVDGNITFPMLGVLHVEGLTRKQLVDLITQKIVDLELLKDPIVIVEFLNLKISVLGEVGRIGTISLQGDRFTLLDAIAASGDLTNNARLDRIGVIREYGDSRRIYWNDIRSKDIFLSPTFYLQQNDIIYVEPTGKKVTQENRNNLFMIQSLFGFVTSTLSLILLFNKL